MRRSTKMILPVSFFCALALQGCSQGGNNSDNGDSGNNSPAENPAPAPQPRDWSLLKLTETGLPTSSEDCKTVTFEVYPDARWRQDRCGTIKEGTLSAEAFDALALRADAVAAQEADALRTPNCQPFSRTTGGEYVFNMDLNDASIPTAELIRIDIATTCHAGNVQEAERLANRLEYVWDQLQPAGEPLQCIPEIPHCPGRSHGDDD
jgi:hypothetical protein